MAYILIDGYNLIGIAHENLEKERNALTEKLLRYCQIKNHSITLVFDGWKSGRKEETTVKTDCLTVIYSRLGETADSLINKMLSSAAKQWIVVSSDREIYNYAERKDFAAISSDEFEQRLSSALYSVSVEDTVEYLESEDDEDDDDMSFQRKGNPRKLSKKQRKKLQALQKL